MRDEGFEAFWGFDKWTNKKKFAIAELLSCQKMKFLYSEKM